MRSAIRTIRPDAVVHLGDFFEDGEMMQEEFSHIRFHLVPGNCDLDRVHRPAPEVLCYDVCGVKLFMTHGHRHDVKMGLGALRSAARKLDAQAALYGHTHHAYCQQEPDGLWVLNPGRCGSFTGSVGLIETEEGKIISCRILRQEDLEGTV